MRSSTGSKNVLGDEGTDPPERSARPGLRAITDIAGSLEAGDHPSGQGIAGDDTHGHVDHLARFVNPTTVVTVVERRHDDPNYGPLRDNLARLQSAKDQDGNPLRVVELPMPAPVVFDHQWLPAAPAAEATT